MFQTWRAIQPNANVPMGSVVSSRIFRNKSFWTFKIPTACPWCVGKIMKMRGDVRHHLQYHVGVNSNFLLWHEPWVQQEPLILRLGVRIISIMGSSSMARINSIIYEVDWQLHRSHRSHCSNHVDALEVTNAILGTRLYARDEILWDYRHSKWVNISYIWNSIRRTVQPSPWIEVVWSPFAVPKSAFFFWLVVLNRLLIRDKMRRFGMITDERCLLCATGIEMASHIFTVCNFAKKIFNACSVQLTQN